MEERILTTSMSDKEQIRKPFSYKKNQLQKSKEEYFHVSTTGRWLTVNKKLSSRHMTYL